MVSNPRWVFLPEVRSLTSLWTLAVRILIWPSASAGSILVTFLGARLVEAHLRRDRACSPSMRGAEDLCHLRGGSGVQLGQGRAGMRQDCNHKECHGNLLGGSGPQPPQVRAVQCNHGEYPDHRALHDDHGLCPDPRALHSRALMVFVMVIGLPGHRIHIMEIHDALVSNQAWWRWVPTSWESGGGIGGCKADLPELPSTASPLQFGDWIHLCGPVMRELSSVASRWWDLTVRQAQVHYAGWKQATPLHRVQVDTRIPEELHDRCYGRTEQRGVHLLLKSVAPEIQQMLVVDRQLTSTAILYRLFIRYQPGGPSEKSLILKELSQLPKTNAMAELARLETARCSWRRHFGRAREVGASLPDSTLLLRAWESGVQLVAKGNSQAAFHLAQSRAALLHVDELPQPAWIWDFSQCLLAEAETLVLMTSSTTSCAETTPLKLKVFEACDPKPRRWHRTLELAAKDVVCRCLRCPANGFAVMLDGVRANNASGITHGRALSKRMRDAGTAGPRGTGRPTTARSKGVDKSAWTKPQVQLLPLQHPRHHQL